MGEKVVIKCNGEDVADGKIRVDKNGGIYNVEVII